MIADMYQVLAVIVGLYAGYGLSRYLLSYLMILFYHRQFQGKDKYLDLYDFMDDEFGYDMFKSVSDSAASYKEYLLLHQKSRPKAYKVFKYYIDDAKSYVKRNTIVWLIIPTVLFLPVLPFFIIPALGIFTGTFLYDHFKKDRRVDFYARLIMISVLKEILKREERRET